MSAVDSNDFHDEKFQKDLAKREFNDDEKATEANRLRKSGTAHFQENEFVEAMADYNAAAEMVEAVPASNALWTSCKFNSALMSVNLNDFHSAVISASEVLKKKQLTRRGEKQGALVITLPLLPLPPLLHLEMPLLAQMLQFCVTIHQIPLLKCGSFQCRQFVALFGGGVHQLGLSKKIADFV